MLLIVFTWALVSPDAVLRFLGKALALFTPFLIDGGLGAFLILLADPGKALWFILFLLVLQQVEGNLIYPIQLKMTLTAREAAEYSSIGINKIDSMLRAPNCSFVLFVGTKKLAKRREFEQYIRRTMAI